MYIIKKGRSRSTEIHIDNACTPSLVPFRSELRDSSHNQPHTHMATNFLVAEREASREGLRATATRLPIIDDAVRDGKPPKIDHLRGGMKTGPQEADRNPTVPEQKKELC